MKKIVPFLLLSFLFIYSSAQNLALNALSSASTDNQPAAFAFDGNPGTRWESAAADPQWITVDIGQSYNVGRVVLIWEVAYGKEYTIQISNDSIIWDTIYTETNSNGEIDDLYVSGTGRYVRMHGTVRATTYGYSLWEMEVYEAIDPTTDATLSDLTIDGTTVEGFTPNVLVYDIELPIGTTIVPTVSASTSQPSPATAVISNASSLPGSTTVLVTAQDGNTQQTYSINFTVDKENIALNKSTYASSEMQAASHAFDGDGGTRWESDFSDPQWIYVDLDSTYEIGAVVLNWEGAFATEYLIEISDDTINWTQVFSETAGDGAIDEIFFAPTFGRYVRMYGTVRATVYGYSLWEMEVYKASDFATDATLSDISVDGTPLIDFATNVFTYTVDLPAGTTTVPDVAATTNHGGATVLITPAAQIPGTTTIDVTAENGISTESYSVTFQTVAGINNELIGTTILFPNPANDILTVQTDSNIESLKIYNLQGKLLIANTPNSSNNTFDVSFLKKGLYILNVNTKSTSYTHKFLKD